MSQSRFGFPVPPPAGEDHTTCPVCGWKPCTSTCRLGFYGWELSALEGLFEEGSFALPSTDFLPPTDAFDPLPAPGEEDLGLCEDPGDE